MLKQGSIFVFKNILSHQLKYTYQLLNQEIKLTEECIQVLEKIMQEIKRKQQSRFQGKFLRLGVDGAQGCSGFKYSFNFDDQVQEDDFVMKDSQDIILVVDEITLKYVNGCVLDYEKKMIRSSFYVQENPNAEKSCSCKISFSPKRELL